MKAAFAQLLLTLLLTSLGLGQNTSTASATASGCGLANVHFEVKSDKHQHPIIKPEPDKAVLYFLQDDGRFQSHPKPTTRLGIDGEWVGATQSNSYFYVTLAPGEHHLCASWQSFVGFGVDKRTDAAAHFTAEPGGMYFFTAKDFWTRESGLFRVELLPLDSDEGQLLASKFSFSTSQAKK